MNVKDAAKEIGCSPETLRKYEREFSLKINRDNRKRRVYSISDVQLLKKIKILRKDNDIETIQSQLNINTESIDSTNQNHQNTDDNLSYKLNTTSNQNHEVVQSSINAKFQELRSELKSDLSTLSNDISGIIELSEKYSRATYEIGHLKAKLESYEEKLKLIESDNKEHEDLKESVEMLNSNLDAKSDLIESQDKEIEVLKAKESDYQRKIAELEKQIPQPKQSWFKRLFK